MARSVHDIPYDGQQFMLLGLFFQVTKTFESVESLFKLHLCAVNIPLFHPVMKGMPSRMLAEHHTIAGATNVFGSHDFVGGGMHEHTMLVYTRFMREGINPHHSLFRDTGRPVIRVSMVLAYTRLWVLMLVSTP